MLTEFDIKYQHNYMKRDLANVPNSTFQATARQQQDTIQTTHLEKNSWLKMGKYHMFWWSGNNIKTSWWHAIG